jgi:hypothetical protein
MYRAGFLYFQQVLLWHLETIKRAFKKGHYITYEFLIEELAGF